MQSETDKTGKVQKRVRKLTAAQLKYLRELGLSKDAVELYSLLVKEGNLTAHASSTLRGTHSSAEYRLYYELERLGLVRHTATRPRVFRATALDKGFKAAYTNISGQLSQLLAQADSSPLSELQLVLGRQALYQRYIELAEQAQHEIWVYAIGIAYNPQLEVLQKRLMKRGISFHHIVQEVKASNYHVIRRWLRLGMQLRHLPSSRGFHLMVFDTSHVIISFSDPNDTEERLSIVTNNPQAIRVFQAQFGMLWAEAKQLDTL